MKPGLLFTFLFLTVTCFAQSPVRPPQTGSTASGTSLAVTVTATGSGHAGVMVVGCGDTAANCNQGGWTVTDNAGGGSSTWTLITSPNTTACTDTGGNSGGMFFAPNLKSGVTSVTFNKGAGAKILLAWVYELGGNYGTFAVDQSNHLDSQGASTTGLGPSLTTTKAISTEIEYVIPNGAPSAVAAPFIFDGAVSGSGAARFTTTATGTYQASFTKATGSYCSGGANIYDTAPTGTSGAKQAGPAILAGPAKLN